MKHIINKTINSVDLNFRLINKLIFNLKKKKERIMYHNLTAMNIKSASIADSKKKKHSINKKMFSKNQFMRYNYFEVGLFSCHKLN